MDLEKVKEIWRVLQEISSAKSYREFEVAYLINERLDNVLESEDEITEDLVRAVENVTNSVDSLLDEYVNEEMDIIEKSFEESEEDE